MVITIYMFGVCMEYGVKELGRAAKYALVAHKGQLDGQGEPYIGHPYRVAEMVGNIAFCVGMSQSSIYMVKIAAVLHDVIEDCGVSFDEVKDELNLGDDIVGILWLLTRKPDEEYGEFIGRIVSSNNIYAILVKISDILDNLDPTRVLPDEQTSIRLKTRYTTALGRLVQSLETLFDNIELENL